MTSRFFLCLTVLFLVASCAKVPKEVLPDFVPSAGEGRVRAACTALFPTGRWQFVHSIAFHMAKGVNGTAIGVVVLSGKEIRCALMTVEGLTLFEARSAGDGDMEVVRAIPPFDNRDFAAGLMQDIRTIFRPPPGTVRYGDIADNTAVCRYSATDKVTDVLPRQDGCWSIYTYSDRIRARSIHARSCRTVASMQIPESLELLASGPAGYSLNMTLISAEPLPAAI
jgi:hypothetical protein